MNYLILFIVLSLSIVGYIKWARIKGIIDKPNERSSHKKPTIRGGGLIFPLAILIWGLLFDHTNWHFVSAVVLLGIIGFLDDLYSLSQVPRLIVQSAGVMLILIEIDLLQSSFFYIFLAFIIITGWLNTFNFMDGINGITVLYAVSILIGTYIFKDAIPGIQTSLIYAVGLSLIIFGVFNVRKNALAFAGDVGSLSMGLILGFFVLHLITNTGRWEFILFLSVYGVDSVMTILYRIRNGENIFSAHRSHLYQYFVNQMNMSHVRVSLLYSLTQLCIISGLFFLDKDYWTLYSIIVLTFLALFYIFAKKKILKFI